LVPTPAPDPSGAQPWSTAMRARIIDAIARANAVPSDGVLNWGGVGAAMPETYGANSPDTFRGGPSRYAGIVHAIGALATLPKRFYDASAAYQPGSGEIPNELIGTSLEAAMLPMGTGAIAGVPMRASEAVLGAGPIRAVADKPSVITSQHFLDEDIVNRKIAAKDFDVTLSPPFEIDGKQYQVILDGHHSLEAARRTGSDPSYTIATPTTDDRLGLLNQGKIDDFLQSAWMDGDYIHAADRKPVW